MFRRRAIPFLYSDLQTSLPCSGGEFSGQVWPRKPQSQALACRTCRPRYTTIFWGEYFRLTKSLWSSLAAAAGDHVFTERLIQADHTSLRILSIMENCALILADDTHIRLLGKVFHRHEVIPRESPVYITKLYFPAVTLDAIAAASMPKKSNSLQI